MEISREGSGRMKQMQWHISHGVIDGVYVGGINIIYPWGIETADRSAFFSLERGVGYRYTVLSEEITNDSRHRSQPPKS
jgi:hypothetical protein